MRLNPIRIVSGMLLLLACAIIVFAAPESDHGRIVAHEENSRGGSLELLSPTYELDEVYMSMQGPRSIQPMIRLSSLAGLDDTIWLTGVQTQVVDAASHQRVSQEFFCHSNLTLNPETTTPDQHNASFDRPVHSQGWTMMTLVPGRMKIELPVGFGLPVKNSTHLDYYTMALNQNAGLGSNNVRLRTRLSYRRNTPESSPVRPLFFRSLLVYQQHKEKADADVTAIETDSTEAAGMMLGSETAAHAAAKPTHVGEHCVQACPLDLRGKAASSFSSVLDNHPGARCCVLNASDAGVVPQFGEENTAHWMVPPGKHIYRTEVTDQMFLPFDTTAHYVTGHLHPFGKSLQLVDLETGEVVFEISSRSLNDRLGVESMSEWKSTDGVPIHKDHRYQLVAEYENKLDRPIDAMGILYLYALDESP